MESFDTAVYHSKSHLDNDNSSSTTSLDQFLYVTPFILQAMGVVTNVMGIVAVARIEMRSSRVVRVLLINLSVGEAAMCACSTFFEIWNTYGTATFHCCEHLLQNSIANTVLFAILFTLLVLSIEQYIALCHPLFHRQRTVARRPEFIAALIWLGSTLCGFVLLFAATIFYAQYGKKLKHPRGASSMESEFMFYEGIGNRSIHFQQCFSNRELTYNYVCGISGLKVHRGYTYIVLTLCIIAVFSMCVLYGLILRALRRAQTFAKGIVNVHRNSVKNQHNMVVTFGILSLAFLLTWAPWLAVAMAGVILGDKMQGAPAFNALVASEIVMSLAFCVSPIIYGVQLREVKRSYRFLCCRLCLPRDEWESLRQPLEQSRARSVRTGTNDSTRRSTLKSSVKTVTSQNAPGDADRCLLVNANSTSTSSDGCDNMALDVDPPPTERKRSVSFQDFPGVMEDFQTEFTSDTTNNVQDSHTLAAQIDNAMHKLQDGGGIMMHDIPTIIEPEAGGAVDTTRQQQDSADSKKKASDQRDLLVMTVIGSSSQNNVGEPESSNSPNLNGAWPGDHRQHPSPDIISVV